MIVFVLTYMASGQNEQHPPGRDQHLGLSEVTDAFLLHLRHMAHKRLDILGPVLVSSSIGKLLEPILQRLLQGTTVATQTQSVMWDWSCRL